MLLTTSGAALLRPSEVADLLVNPTLAQSVAAQISTIVNIGSTAFRIPRVVTDPVAQWVGEGQEISVSDAVLDEVVVTPSKIAALSVISSELAMDSSPEAATAIGDGMSRDIATRIDAAFFGAASPPAQSGLGALSGVQTVVSATAFADLDAFAAAVCVAQVAGANIDAFVCSPAVALALATVKTGTGSDAPLLGQDGTVPTARQILGIQLFVSPAVAANTLWAIDSSRTYVVVRQDSSIEADSSVLFTSDRVAIRGIMRVGFGFAHPASIVKITTS